MYCIKMAPYKEQGKDIQVPTQSSEIVEKMSDHQLLSQKSIPVSLKEVDLCVTVDSMQ